MKKILLYVLLVNSLFAQEYYAKIEALNAYSVKAAVNGKIIFSNTKIEGMFAKNTLIIQIDDSLDLMDLKQSKYKRSLINKMISIEDENYSRLKKVSSKSIFEKETQKLKVINLQSNKADLDTKIATLKDRIKNKKLYEKSNYIFNIHVKEGEYVNPGTLLYESKDLSKGKVELFIPIDDAKDIKKKLIYVNDKKTNLKISTLYEVADAKHISSYKAVIILEDVKKFSSLAKIEFK